ncbi:hypothetical protein H2198_007201 [Neophaeococcomyces mojaviensis]|uniref:Uncharacterized protein n=1 Tax=Neophaeococcomyces mojaviensis TaxID=3383035 RepID=A0ACC3A0Q8_9EURO|nr:hypothetical protein H2198_007201 [Knufia sp. JES_112]
MTIDSPDPFPCMTLSEWKQHYENMWESLWTHYQFSLEWNKLWHTAWAKYDKLETARLQASADRFEWQDKKEEVRREIEEVRKAKYAPLATEHQQLCPLSIQLDKHLQSHNQDRLYPWRSTLSNWIKFQDLYNENSENGKLSLRECLSQAQESSYSVLKDWWTSVYCNDQLLEVTRSYIDSHLNDTGPSFPDLDSLGDTYVGASLYHAYCLELFLDEFHPCRWEPYISHLIIFRLQQSRAEAVVHAMMQRLSYVSILPSVDVADQKIPPRPYPRVLINENKWIGYSKEHMPMYLWDVIGRKTVLVSDLPVCPIYTCVSHTWGRWRVQGSEAEVQGVPWKVPENSLYNVRDLPQKFDRLHKAYLWFDLFCIPQDGRPVGGIEIARQASIFGNCEECIAWMHDVERWEGTQRALNWLAMKYIQHTTRFENSADIDELVQKSLGAAQAMSTEIFKLNARSQRSFLQHEGMFKGVPNTSHGEPSSWFSSLWTLQEAVLCPDIILYSKDFQPLQDRSGFPISLSIMMVFIDRVKPYAYCKFNENSSFTQLGEYETALSMMDTTGANYTPEWPASAASLCNFVKITRLATVLVTLSPMDVLINATVRQCTGSPCSSGILTPRP